MIRRLREPDNGLTHLAGALLALAVLVVLVRLGLAAGSPPVLAERSVRPA